MRKTLTTTLLCSALAMTGMAMAAGAASAQTVDEITVMGRLGPDGKVAELSKVVSFADLDLTRPGDADILKTRVKDTARELCSKLGESNNSTPLVPTCEQQARADAMKQVDTAIASAVPRSMPPAAAASSPTTVADNAAADVNTATSDAAVTTPAASYTVSMVTNGPVPDTAENRARFGGPMSRAGKRTAAAGN